MNAIRTPDHRVRVFVSSTLGELAEERQMVREAIEGLRLTPVMFEVGARPHPPRALYRAYLEQSDVFVGVYWERYGWVAPEETVSGLEDEYELARQLLPQLVYLKEPAPDREPRLAELLERIQEHDQLSYRRFSNAAELATVVSDDLAMLLSERFGDRARTDGVAPRSAPPAPLDATLGREDDVAAIVDLVRNGSRLITLTGPGGIGKSRLGIEAAGAMGATFPDGAVYVALSSLTDPALVLPTIAERVGAHADRREDVPDALAAALGRRPTLLLLDNFEQVAGAAPDIAALLGRSPGTVALVTSRHLLRVSGEQEYRVPPLADRAAIDLFLERASTGGTAVFDDEDRMAIAEICHRLDGLPLAIELTAAWARVIAPRALLARIVDHVELPSRAGADLPERQRTLRATMDWSYALLDDAERALLARLAVFAGGWTLGAATAVCGCAGEPEVLETMSSLLEKSLVVSVGDPDLEPRFRMLETVRAYAEERLGEMDDRGDVERRHVDWMIGVLFEEFGAVEVPRSIARMDRERANLRVAVRRALDLGDVGAVSVLVQGSMAYLSLRDSEHEGAAWLDEAIARSDGAPSMVRARLLVSRALLAAALASYEEAEHLLHEARSADAGIFDDGFSGAVAMMAEAIVETARTESGTALPLAIRAAEAMTEVNSFAGATYMWMTSGMVTLHDDPDQAATFLHRALELAGDMGNDDLRCQTMAMLGFCASEAHDDALALERFGEAASISQRSGQRSSMILAVEGLATAALIAGRPDVAARAYGCAAATRTRLARPAWAVSQPILDAIEQRAIAALGQEAFAAAVSEGAALDIAEGLDRAYAELAAERGIAPAPGSNVS